VENCKWPIVRTLVYKDPVKYKELVSLLCHDAICEDKMRENIWREQLIERMMEIWI
jgi:hypothetical protein